MKRILFLVWMVVVAWSASAAQKPCKAPKTLKVLAIGNSFSADAVEQNLWEIAKADGCTMVIGNLYIGGCTLEKHWENARSDAPAYSYRKVVNGKKTTIPDYTLSQALKDEKWDVVTLQQQSLRAAQFESFEPSLPELLAYVRARVPKKTKIVFHRTWAYENDYVGTGFERFDRKSARMFEAVTATTQQVCEKYGISTTIPSAAAIQNLRRSEVLANVCRDGTHLNLIGRYAVALTWYEALTGRNVVGNTFDPPHIEPWVKETAQLAAHAAVLEPEKAQPVGPKPHQAQYDESAVPPYILPDPLVMADGTPVATPEQWFSARRPEILKVFTEQVYGKSPAPRSDMRFELVEASDSALGGLSRRKQVKLYLGKNDKYCLNLLIYLPRQAEGPVPMFAGINFQGNWAVNADPDIIMPDKAQLKRYAVVSTFERGAQSRRWPLEQILSAGYGLLTFYRGDTDPDFHDGWQNGIAALGFRKGQTWPEPDEWGTISQWAWSLSRAMDYMESDPDIDASRVAVVGHSRLGKTSLWAGAQDERFALVISNCSGAGGSALSRRMQGEVFVDLNHHFPHWFCENFHAYSNREAELPVDQHELMALIAPRPLYIASATGDRWADPKGEFTSALEASKVYEFLGVPGLQIQQWPAAGQPSLEGNVAYHIREGKHDILSYDWGNYIRFADKYLK